jgi:hypothetical protein
MQTTLTGKGPKCRVCTHSNRRDIESLLARGAGIAAIKPIMGGTFSRRALYRHRARHMITSGSPAGRPILFPFEGTPIERIKWLQREAEHTAALAEQRGNLSAKLKALHELSRLIWLEQRLSQSSQEDASEILYQQYLTRLEEQSVARLEEAHAKRAAALGVSAFVPPTKAGPNP